MSCSNLTGGIALDCLGQNGGIEAIFVANGPISGYTEAAGVVTAISVAGSPLDPTDFFKFEVPKQTSSITETPTISQENGTIMYQQDVTMIFNKLTADKRNKLLLMFEANEMVVVVKDNNGLYWSVGLERGAFVTSATATSGTVFTDRSGYEIVVSGQEKEPMFAVTGTIVEAA